jgi:tetratricopeptide (TPR) repeat protein
VLALALLALPVRAGEDGGAREQARALVERVQEALRERDRSGVATCFDVDEVVAEVSRSDVFEGVPADARDALLPLLGVGLRIALAQDGLLEPFTTYDIRSIEAGPGAGRARVYVRLVDEEGWVAKLRWYVVERPSGWRIYDIEDLDVSLRLTTMMGVVLADGVVPGRRPWVRAALNLWRVLDLVEEDAGAEARPLLEELEGLEPPDAIQAVVQVLLAGIESTDGEHERALARLERAGRLNPDMPVLDYLQAHILNEIGRHEEALRRAQRYTERTDTDPQVDLEAGRALLALGRRDAAATILRRAWTAEPKDPEIVAHLGMALPPEERESLRAPLAGLRDVEAGFEQIAELCLSEGRIEALLAFATLFEDLRPEHPDGPYYRGQAAWAQDDFAGASEFFHVALTRFEKGGLDPSLRDPYVSAFVHTMVDAGNALGAFDRLTDKADAFRRIASALKDRGAVEPLRRLLTRIEGDPSLALEREGYAAEVDYLEARYTAALGRLRALLARIGAPGPDAAETVWTLVYGAEDRLVRVLVRLQKLDEALAEAERIRVRDDDWFYVAMVRAHRGEVSATEEAFAQLVESGWDADDLVSRAGLGEVIAEKAFAPLRRRYGLGD